MSKGATAILAQIPDDLDIYDREEILLREARAGNIVVEWVKLAVSSRLKVWVTRDYLAFGNKCDSVRLGSTGFTQQLIGDLLNALLITPKVSDIAAKKALEDGGLVGLHTQKINSRTSGYVKHSGAIDAALPEGYGGIVAGPKDWCLSLDVWAKRGFVTNYGGTYKRGSRAPAPTQNSVSDWDLVVIQGPYEAHDTGRDIDGDGDADGGHADYSQLMRFMRRDAELDGKAVDLKDCIMGKHGQDVAAMLNHEGVGLPGYRLPGVPLHQLVANDNDDEEDIYEEVDDVETPPRITRAGERGVDVVKWQQWLIANGYPLPKYGADGIHSAGGETEAATKKWLADRGLEPAEDDKPAPPDTLPDDVEDFDDVKTIEELAPPITFVQAKYYGRGRPRGEANNITIHTAEISELPTGAEALQSVAANNTRQASWNYATDNNSATKSVNHEDRSYAAGPGNDRGIHIEITGRAGQGEAGWKDDFSQSTLEITAALVAKICCDEDIPVTRLDAFDLIAEKAGITGHKQWSEASVKARRDRLKRAPWWNPARGKWRTTNHGDPGKWFPWKWFMDRVRLHVAVRRHRGLAPAA